MLIVTESGEAINAHHTVRFFLQSETHGNAESEPAQYRLVLQLTNRQKVTAAEVSGEAAAQALFRDVVRQWVRGQTCIEVAASLKRILKGESGGNGREEICL